MYLELFNKLHFKRFLDYEYVLWREALRSHFSYGIPDKVALKIISRYSPLVEIGAGNGYWAYLLSKVGADILAYDLFPPLTGTNFQFSKYQWFLIFKGGPEVLSAIRNRNLLICWPPYNDNMAKNCLTYFKGEFVIYIGENKGGCNGTDSFFDNLEKEYTLVKVHNLSHWAKDNLGVWKRKSSM